jgi:hypothetical protein
MKYDVDYFINKFSAIPDNLWITQVLTGWGAHCALGHCDVTETHLMVGLPDEARVLAELLGGDERWQNVATINDGEDARYTQPTPKARILAALADVKKALLEAELRLANTNSLQLAPIHSNSECCHIWLACGVCMICSATKPVQVKELV